MSGHGSSATKRLSLSGILIALTVITLFIASIAPTNKLALYALSSFFTAVIVIEFGIKTGWVFYISSSMLSLLIIQNKIRIVPYIAFFGLYGIVKFYTERLGNIVLEYVLKIIYFNVCLYASIQLVKELFAIKPPQWLPWWAIIAGFQVVFLLYDYVYTLFVQYYNQKLRKLLRI
ncbi:MAG: hypothetical protein N3B21_18285 [Clostridia bacterium]|nr:hypothetical protein [Clostridia bacterium]